MREFKSHTAIQSSDFREKSSNIGKNIAVKSGYVLRFMGIRLVLWIIQGTGLVLHYTGRVLQPAGAVVWNLTKRFFLGGTLNLFFFFLKGRRRFKLAFTAGRTKAVALFNLYAYKFTIAVIILITLGYNLTARNLNAEELKSTIILNSVIKEQEENRVTLIEEGRLAIAQEISANGYLDNDTVIWGELIEPDYDPTTDTDAPESIDTTEDGGAIASPIIVTPDGSPTIQRDRIETYTVQQGDTISSIAQRFGVSTNTILWQNNLTAYSTIRPGQQLTILPTSGVSHVVKSGDTLTKIAKQYQSDIDKIITANKLADISDIRAGEVLVIPNGVRPTAVKAVVPEKKKITSVIRDIFVPPAATDDAKTRLLWPLASKRITQYYHLRHSGLDVGDKVGQPIYAAESGKVERAGWNTGYGYNVVINHGNGLKTLYGHSSKLLVAVGDTVERGQVIALIGNTGRSTGPHLHFEVMINGKRSNPLTYVK